MKRFILSAVLIIGGCLHLSSQENDVETLELTLREVIELAQTQSPDILNARHTFRSQYWSYVSYKANYLPSLNFYSSPYFNHSIAAVTQPDGTIGYRSQNVLVTDATLSIEQNVAFTGGTFSIYTNLNRIDDLNTDKYSYSSTPIQVSYNQSLFGYNSLKWNRKIEPLRFEEAKKDYVEALERVARTAVNRFFSLAMAQITSKSAQMNYENAKQTYEYAQGRYNIGTITESEMLQLEINMLSAETSLMNSTLNLDDYTENLRSFLRLKETSAISLVIDDIIPLTYVNPLIALEQAGLNSPDVIGFERQLLESESNVAYVKAANGINADLNLKFGLGKTDDRLSDAYRDLSNQQNVSLSISIPILDWGRRKGRVELAKSSRDIVYAQIEQDKRDFEANLTKTVKQFNLQPNTLRIAQIQDEKADKRSEVARNYYLAGKSSILDLNSAIQEKDNAKSNYINAIYNYWYLYYSLRMITLYDFGKNIPITEDYKLLIK